MIRFPAKAFKLKSSGAVVIIHPCCICGDSNAPFGRDVSLLYYPRSLGNWFCSKKCESVMYGSTQKQLL